MRVARALAGLPRIDAAFAKARLSYSMVRAITRVADESNEEALLEMALYCTASQLDRICRGIIEGGSTHITSSIGSTAERQRWGTSSRSVLPATCLDDWRASSEAHWSHDPLLSRWNGRSPDYRACVVAGLPSSA